MLDSDMDSSLIDFIKYPLVTDKGTRLLENNQYTFIVDPRVKKPVVKKAIESFFDVTVIKVNSCNLPRKKRRIGRFEGYKSKYKKVIVTLADEDSIEILPEI